MAETGSHKRGKGAAAGKREVRIKGNRRIDSMSARRATEIERGGSLSHLQKAARKLKASGKPQKVLQVPDKDMAKARTAMKNVGVSGTVKNMSGTKRSYVSTKK